MLRLISIFATAENAENSPLPLSEFPSSSGARTSGWFKASFGIGPGRQTAGARSNVTSVRSADHACGMEAASTRTRSASKAARSTSRSILPPPFTSGHREKCQARLYRSTRDSSRKSPTECNELIKLRRSGSASRRHLSFVFRRRQASRRDRSLGRRPAPP